MHNTRFTRKYMLLPLFAAGLLLQWREGPKLSNGKAYYLRADGDDRNKGSRDQPWKTITRLNTAKLLAGDTVYLEGGQTFSGTIQLDSADAGNAQYDITVTSTGNGKATIDGGNGPALVISNTYYIAIRNLQLTGNGRKEGNTANGLSIAGSAHIRVDSMDITGFQKAGLSVHLSADVHITNVYAHENGFAGIAVTGSQNKGDCRDIYMSHCRTENNPGDPSNLDNHSGNGIVVGNCRKLTIEYCTATNNGWDMPRKGNGPVGIWAFEADSVVIQHCISYRNKTSTGSEDGGGFDLDGGVTNSVLQYCLSYENHGSGIGIFQYNGASTWNNNIIRYNISENDGSVSTAKAGVYIWNDNSSGEQFGNCFFYNNVVYNSRGAALHYALEGKRHHFYFYNNIFVARKELINGETLQDTFLSNNWWCLTGRFNIGGIRDLKAWAARTGQEQYKGQLTGLNENPGFRSPGNTALTNPAGLKTFDQYQTRAGSPLRSKGLDLQTLFGIETGNLDFNQKEAPVNGIGACF